ncbi:MAG: 16S rRNA (guanine(966)-N(2))-methyltransferase RsmD [Pseudomonadota bacterium]
MRIIAGKWRGRLLEQPPQNITRPTTDRVREALFSMLISRIGSFDGLYVFDAFAGSGALGLEALSRGALHVTFAEKDKSVRPILHNNVVKLKCEDQISIVEDAFRISKIERPFDLVLMDPPYGAGLESELFSFLVQQGVVNKKTLIVIESHSDSVPMVISNVVCLDYRIYGNCALSFFELDFYG